MSAPLNYGLYRVLVKIGASEDEAREAATVDLSNREQFLFLVTKVELKAQLTELRTSLLLWTTLLLMAQTALLLTILTSALP